MEFDAFQRARIGGIIRLQLFLRSAGELGKLAAVESIFSANGHHPHDNYFKRMHLANQFPVQAPVKRMASEYAESVIKGSEFNPEADFDEIHEDGTVVPRYAKIRETAIDYMYRYLSINGSPSQVRTVELMGRDSIYGTPERQLDYFMDAHLRIIVDEAEMNNQQGFLTAMNTILQEAKRAKPRLPQLINDQYNALINCGRNREAAELLANIAAESTDTKELPELTLARTRLVGLQKLHRVLGSNHESQKQRSILALLIFEAQQSIDNLVNLSPNEDKFLTNIDEIPKSKLLNQALKFMQRITDKNRHNELIAPIVEQYNQAVKQNNRSRAENLAIYIKSLTKALSTKKDKKITSALV